MLGSGQSICILSGNHLCHNPRVFKEAATLARAGFDVEVLGAWLDPTLRSRDVQLVAGARFRYTPVIDLTTSKLAAKSYRLALRARKKAGNIAFAFAGLQTAWQLGPAAGALNRAADRRRADMFVAHSEAGLHVAHQLMASGRRVAVDMEDWFSEDLLPDARRWRPIRMLRDLERELLRNGAYSTCPSEAMREALSRTHECRPPVVIYNAFSWASRKFIDGEVRDRLDRRLPSIHWFSQTLGEGRGLEDLLGALPHLSRPVEIHLRGTPTRAFLEWVEAHTKKPWRDRIFVHDLVHNAELLSRIAEHDIGFAGEMIYCQSRNLTVTNKILEYLLGGLAVVASDTVGQREVAARAADAVRLYPSGNSLALAAEVNVLLESPGALGGAKLAALEAAKTTFCWERQERALLETVAGAMGIAPSRVTT